MTNRKCPEPRAFTTPWEDIVDDFLEMAGELSSLKRRRLIACMRSWRPSVEEIGVHACFSLDGQVIVLVENPAEKVWVFNRADDQLMPWLPDPDAARCR